MTVFSYVRVALPPVVARFTVTENPGARVPDTTATQTIGGPPFSGTLAGSGGTICTFNTERRNENRHLK